MKGRVWAASVMVLVGVSSFWGCDDKKKETTAEPSASAPAPPPPATSSAPVAVEAAAPPPAPDVADAAVVEEIPAVIVDASAPPPVEASNVADIARYPDEKKSDELVNVKFKLADVHKAASEADVIATLQKGAAVKKIATHGVYYLVVFEDPTNKGRNVMGWMTQKAIDTEEPDAGVPPVITCRTGLTAFAGQGNTIHCELRCLNEAPCPGDLACEGEGIISRNGVSVGRGNFCIKSKAIPAPPTVVIDAGAPPPPVDAGVAKPDAGAVAAVDAGTKPVMTVRLHVPKVGPCLGGYVMTPKHTWCRLVCNSNADCSGSPNATCQNRLCYAAGEGPSAD